MPRKIWLRWTDRRWVYEKCWHSHQKFSKRNAANRLTNHTLCGIMNTTEPATPLHNAQPGGAFFAAKDFFMYNYPKPYLSESELIQKLIDSGMAIPSLSEAEEALSTIGYYRLRGYCYHLYNYSTNRYIEGTNFSDILKLYRFDTELSHLLFSYLSQIEIALRVRFVHAFQPMQDVLVLNDPSIFKDKEWYWKNQSTIAGEIARSDDVFILHNYEQYDGAIPLWATVEILSFGMLSKLIKNLKTGSDSAFSRIAQFYKYTNQRGN